MSRTTTTPERSALMRRVRQKGTAAEVEVRAALAQLGARYRLNVSTLPGSPDISNQSRKKAIFVHGCFWHFHESCGRGKLPRRNREFWEDKLRRNVERDHRKVGHLTNLGFDVLTVWECELKDPEALQRRLQEFWFGRT